MRKPSAWDQHPKDTDEVRYWKREVRHYQAIAPLLFVSGFILGAVFLSVFLA